MTAIQANVAEINANRAAASHTLFGSFFAAKENVAIINARAPRADPATIDGRPNSMSTRFGTPEADNAAAEPAIVSVTILKAGLR